jgi:hypothetical protein
MVLGAHGLEKPLLGGKSRHFVLRRHAVGSRLM